MSGCPVDSIHRGKHLQIVIEDHCIGCGLCASNCPYGNIFMVPNQRRIVEVLDPTRPRATRNASRSSKPQPVIFAMRKEIVPRPNRCVSPHVRMKLRRG